MLALAANKSDLERSRQVKQADVEAYAASIGAALFGTSAKLDKGVEQAFHAIATSASSACARCVLRPSHTGFRVGRAEASPQHSKRSSRRQTKSWHSCAAGGGLCGG